MQILMQQGKIRRWGVSNLDYAEIQTLWQLTNGRECATNQVLYHLGSRGIEFDLLPWCQQQAMPIMAYCPLAQAGRLHSEIITHPTVMTMANRYQISVAQLLLAWVIHHPGVMAIPKAGTVAHVRENAAALQVALSESDIARLNAAFPAPQHKTPLDMV